MGSIILCHRTKARNPYEITRVHKKIYTLEELCYYLTHNLYLIDNTIMNEQFCGWLKNELDLNDLADELKDALLDHCGREQFVCLILRHSNIYNLSELRYIEEVLAKIKDQKVVERNKNKADNLLENGEVEEAILVYQAILREERDTTVSEQFYGKVYACLGAAFGRAFLYQESMDMYDKAFQICNDPILVKSYLYAASKAMNDTDYKLFLAKSQVFEELNEIITKEIEHVKTTLHFKPSQEVLEKWKTNYRLGNMS
ncbi:MAG: hypothetical protein R3Y58_00840 [Eubacteriales bacterium]